MAHMKMALHGVPRWRVATQTVRRGWRLCARGRLEAATHLPHITARNIARWAAAEYGLWCY